MTARQYFPCRPRKMPPQRGQPSRQSPACRFYVGGAGSGSLRCPTLLPLGQTLPFLLMSWAPSETASLRCRGQGHKLSLRHSEAGRAPTCPGQRCASGPGYRRGHRVALSEEAPAAQRHGGGLAERHTSALGRHSLGSFPAGKEQRLAKKALGRSKWHFSPKCEKRRENPLPPSVLPGRAGDRSGTGAMEGDGGSWGQPASRRCRSPLPVGPAGVAGAAGARRLLRSPDLRGLFNPPIAETLTGV